MSEYSSDSSDSSDSDPYAHPNYGRVVTAARVGMGMLTSEIPAEHEPVIKVARSLYDKEHCGGCDARGDSTVENWKNEHINENIECRRAYRDNTCRYERAEFAVIPDPPYQPHDYIPPSETPQLQHPAPQFQAQQVHTYVTPYPPFTQSQTQPNDPYTIPNFPQYAEGQQTQQIHTYVTPYPPFTQSQTQPNDPYAIPNFPQYAEGQQGQQPALDAYWTNYPSPWLEATANTGQPGQQYNPQQSTEMYDPSYADNTSSTPASHNPNFTSNTQEWISHPSATSSPYQDGGYYQQ
ncbi:hypothetical protein OCU04_008619 [Sclerotinia nivalis]|uniref:Uncharacterized protein n=1 Tax=Sclerotinia nivalis TaxID=352851 RepID=A0A9X0AJH8_9HELO|nr:hypothetical protein OCU04_008619 [Sclerotinia nivalis]